MHASFSFHHSILQLAYTTQAWILKFKTCAMQANIWNAHSNASIKFMNLLPLLVCSKFNWSSYFVISLLLCQNLPLSLTSLFLPLVVFSLSLYTISPPLSSMTTKVQNVDRLRLSMPINGVRIIFPNLVQFRTFAKGI